MQEASRVQAAAEVAALLASPPPWLDLDGPHDTELTPLDLHNQRGRGPPATKLAWRWSCAVRAPEGSPYAVCSYRVLVRFPVGYPLLPPRLHVLSVLHHIEVDLRDPFEGQVRRAGPGPQLSTPLTPSRPQTHTRALPWTARRPLL